MKVPGRAVSSEGQGRGDALASAVQGQCPGLHYLQQGGLNGYRGSDVPFVMGQVLKYPVIRKCQLSACEALNGLPCSHVVSPSDKQESVFEQGDLRHAIKPE